MKIYEGVRSYVTFKSLSEAPTKHGVAPDVKIAILALGINDVLPNMAEPELECIQL